MKKKPTYIALEQRIKALETELLKQKRAEIFPFESLQAKFDLVAKSITEAFWITNPSIDRVYYVSPEYELIWGRTCQSLYENPKSFIDTIHPDDKDRVINNLAVKSTGQPFNHEYRIIHYKDGSLKWIWERGFPVYDKVGEIEQYVGIAQDVTERKQLERNLEKKYAILRSYLDNLPALFFVKDLNGCVIDVNKAFEILFDAPATELIGKTDRDFHLPEDALAIFANDQLVAETNRTMTFEEPTPTPDGMHIFRSTKFPLKDPGGRVFATGGISFDITDQKIAEAALSASEAKYRHLFETMTQGVVIQDAEGKIMEANPAACEILGLSMDQMLGKTAYDPRWKLIHEDGTLYDPYEMPSNIALRTGRPVKDVICGIYVPEKNEYRWIAIGSAPQFKDDQTKPFATMTVFTDITNRNLAENALKKSEERYRSLVEDQIEMVSRFKSDGTILFANNGYCRFFGKTREELLGTKWHPVVHPDDLPNINEQLAELCPGHPTVIIENRVYNAKGELCWAQFSNRAFFDESGVLQEIQSVGRDVTDRKQAEQTIRKSHENLQALMENTDDFLMIADRDGNPVVFNSAYARVMKEALGIDMKPGLKPHKLLPDKNAVEYWDNLHARVLGGEAFKAEYSHNFSEETVRHFEISLHPIITRDGIKGFSEVTRDITERKVLEAALKASEKKYRLIFEQSPAGIMHFDTNGVITECNAKFAEIIGAPKEKLVNFNMLTAMPNGEARQAVQDAIEKGEGHFEGGYHTVSGDRRIFIKAIHRMITDDEGRELGAVGIFEDITECRLSEAALRENEAQFRHFFEHLTIGVAVYEAVENGRDFAFFDMNPAGQKLSKVSIEEIRGKRLTQVFPGVRNIGLFRAIQDTWRTGKPCHVPFQQYKDERITQWVENRLFKLPSGKIVAVYDDRTELMRLEEGLRQAQKMEAIGTLAGGIAHDFNNLLSVLTGNISYALSVTDKDDNLYDALSDMMQGAKQAQHLTHQLLTFAKGGEPIKKACDINKLLEESAKFVTSGAMSRCNFKPADDLWAAEIDSGQVNQVISNIVINADQAMPDGGIITIRTVNEKIETNNTDFQLSAGRYIKISIEDQGIGIQEKHLSNIFNPYFTTKHRGSGLGLATAYSIVKRHGGHITVYSEVGRGTVFNIYLPASSQEIVEVEDKEESKHHGHGNILIMDDQEPILRMIERMLERMGYETQAVTDGAEAVESYRSAYDAGNPFDLVILDLTVPGGMGGARTIPELLKLNPNVKAVVSSGYSNDPIMADYQDYGFCGVIPKPYTKEHLSELLNRVLSVNMKNDEV